MLTHYDEYRWQMERKRKRMELVSAVKEIAGGVVLMSLLFAFAALCVVGSGYNWQ